jgi:hypothetical protein
VLEFDHPTQEVDHPTQAVVAILVMTRAHSFAQIPPDQFADQKRNINRFLNGH